MIAKRAGAPRVWHVGGDDVHLRIPLLLRLRAAGFDVAAAGAGCWLPFETAGIPYFEYGLAPGLSPDKRIVTTVTPTPGAPRAGRLVGGK